jgi:hypothetical protein
MRSAGSSESAARLVAGPGAGGVVSRPGLWERLERSARVTVVSAPPGSGKTVLLRSWIGQAGLAGRAAWVPVERDERDPQRFWLAVLGALRQTAAGLGLVRELTAAPDLDGWAIVERLLTDLAPLGERLWLVIDDLHELGPCPPPLRVAGQEGVGDAHGEHGLGTTDGRSWVWWTTSPWPGTGRRQVLPGCGRADGGWAWSRRRFRVIFAVRVARRALEGHAATRVPPGPGRLRAECWPHDPKERVLVLLCLDAAAAARDLAAGTLACPSCTEGRLARWGHGAERVIRLRDRRARLRPDRARCRSCHRTHILLPSWCAPRRADGIEVIGAAAGAAMAGAGHRPIAAALGVPPGTVRGWLRRLRARAGALRSHAIGELARPGLVPARAAVAAGRVAAGRCAERGGGRRGLRNPPVRLRPGADLAADRPTRPGPLPGAGPGRVIISAPPGHRHVRSRYRDAHADHTRAVKPGHRDTVTR